MDLTTPDAGHPNEQAGLTVALDRAFAAIGLCVTAGSPVSVRMGGLRERWREKQASARGARPVQAGKSSFVNALLGAPLLPIGVMPLTAVPTFNSWRAQPLVAVRFKGERAPEQPRARRRRVRTVRQMRQLVVRNAENLRWAVLRGMDDTFRNAAASLDERLDDAIAATRGVSAEALARQSDRSAALAPELAWLTQAVVRLSALSEELATAGAGHST